MNEEKLATQMKKWVLEYIILLIISKKPSYASDIISILNENNLIVVEWTLYPLLSRLKEDWMLEYSWQESKSWPPRKYYSISKKWEKLIESMKKVWDQLSKSVENIQGTQFSS